MITSHLSPNCLAQTHHECMNIALMCGHVDISVVSPGLRDTVTHNLKYHSDTMGTIYGALVCLSGSNL